MRLRNKFDKTMTGSQLDQLAVALSKQIASESDKSPNGVLWEIVDAAQKISQKKSAASSVKRSGLRSSKEDQTLAASKA